MNRANRIFYLFLVYLFLYLPICLIIIFSFNDSQHALNWQGFSWRWYVSLFQDPIIWKVTWHSVFLGICSASFSVIIGFLVSFTTFRYRFVGRKVIYGITSALVVVPEIVIAVSLLLLYNFFHIPLGLWSLLLGHTALCVPYTTIILTEQLFGLDKDIFAAALDLGASDWMIMQRITFPLIRSALMAAWLLAFTLSFDDIIISYFAGGPSFTVLPFKIYAMVRFGVKPEINALCSLMMVFTLLMTLVTYRLLRYRLYE